MNDRFRRISVRIGTAALVSVSVGCAVGPSYRRPDVPTPPSFKEEAPAGWQDAKPDDAAIRGNWWEMFGDAGLNALEARVSISNQNVLAAEAQFQEARAAVKIVGANRFPTVTAAPVATETGAGGVPGGGRPLYSVPVDVTYQVDVWGSIRRSVRANAAAAQASEAQLENARLLYQSELAADYFQLEGLDAARR